jgi:hypothetical protein
LILALEPRFMFDGAGVADAVDARADQADPAPDHGTSSGGDERDQGASETDEPSPSTPEGVAATPAEETNRPGKVVAFVENNVDDYQTLVEALDPDVEVVILDSSEDGLTAMADWARTHSDYDAIHLISHGAEGQVDLGDLILDEATAATRSADLATLGAALTADGDILLYGCEVASGAGQSFIESIAEATDADVAASTDTTGAASLGGDWVLEAQVGDIEANTVATALAQSDYESVLGPTSTGTATWGSGFVLGSGTGSATNANPASHGFSVTGYALSPSQSMNANQIVATTDHNGKITGGAMQIVTGAVNGLSYVDVTATDSYTFDASSIDIALSHTTDQTTPVTMTISAIDAANGVITSTTVQVTPGTAASNLFGVTATLGAAFDDMRTLRISAGSAVQAIYLDNMVWTDAKLPPAPDTTSTVSAGGGAEPTTIATTSVGTATATALLDFTIADQGGGDGYATKVSSIDVDVSGTADPASLVFLLNGPDATNVVGSYSGGVLTFSGLSLSVADGANETYTISAYFNDNAATSDVIEDQTLVLSVNAADFTMGGSSSTMAGAQSDITNGAGAAVDITATKLVYTQEPSGTVTSGQAFGDQPVVQAVDARGNLDLDFSGTITLTENGLGSLGGTVAVAATNGVATFSGVGYTAASDADANFVLTASTTGLTSAATASLDPDVVATHLAFTTEPAPTSVASGASTSFTTVPVVSAVDADGLVDTDWSTAIVLSVTDPNDGSVDGTVNSLTGTNDTDGVGTTVTLAPVNGVATYSNLALQYTNSGGANDLSLLATSTGLTSAESATITSDIIPTVTDVSSTTTDGAYNVGDTITIEITFSTAVDVTGTPQLTLETGSTDRVATYASGSGTTTLVFTYTIQAGDTAADLDYVGTSALALNGGTIQSSAGGTAATLTLASPGAAGSLGANGALVVDTTTPSITSGATASVAEGATAVTTVTATDTNAVTYSIVAAGSGGAADGAAFAIDANTGALTFQSAPDYESPTDSGTNNVYLVTVRATDAAGNTTDQVITVTVTNVNETPVISDLAGDSVNASAGGSAIPLDSGAALVVSDPDNTPLSSATVEITGGYTSSEDVLAFVNDGSTMGDITGSWNGATGTLTLTSASGTATAAEWTAALKAVTYQNTNAASVSTGTRTVSWTVNDGTTDSATVTSSVVVARSPIIDLNTGTSGDGATASFTEDDGAVAVTGTTSASDDGTFKSVTVTLTNPQDGVSESLSSTYGTGAQTVNGEAVTIGTYNSATGVLTITIVDGSASAATVQMLLESIRYDNASDDPDTTTRQISFEVTDDEDNVGSAVVSTVSVTGANDAPTLTSNGGGATGSTSAAEGQTAVTTVTATDPDTGDSQAYSISGGADASKFTINPTTGVLTFRTAPDFENPTDTGSNNTYEVEVTVTDGDGLTDSQVLTVTVTNIDDNPAFTSATTASVSEAATVGTTVINVNANDGDGGGADVDVTYSIVSGNTGSAFSIDPNTGVITVAGALDRETKGTYTLVIRASDGVKTTDQTITVTLADANDNAPVITSNGGGTTATTALPENATRVTTVTATDADASDSQAYSISGGADAALFSIDRATGVLTFRTAPDFESRADANGDNVYEVTVTVTDGNGATDSQTLRITVTNVNETPKFTETDATLSGEQGKPQSLDLDATDGDGGAVDAGVTYAITGGTAAGAFSINSATGLVTGGATLAPGTYTLVVTVSDGGKTSSRSLTVTVAPATTDPNTDGDTQDGDPVPTPTAPPSPPSPVVVAPPPAPPAIGLDQGTAILVTYPGSLSPIGGGTLGGGDLDGGGLGGDGFGAGGFGAGGLGAGGLGQTGGLGGGTGTGPAGGQGGFGGAGDPGIGSLSVDAGGPGTLISVTVPGDAFGTALSLEGMTLAALQADGSALPSWLSFDPATGTLSGTPPAGATGVMTVRVMGRDATGRTAAFVVRVNLSGGAAGDPGAANPDGAPDAPDGAPPDQRGALEDNTPTDLALVPAVEGTTLGTGLGGKVQFLDVLRSAGTLSATRQAALLAAADALKRVG